MAVRDNLTNEKLRGIFKNNFELTNYAIRLGRYYMRAGHEVSLEELLEQVRKNPSESYLAALQQMDIDEAKENGE